MPLVLLLVFTVPRVAAACERECAELTQRNFVGLDESPVWSMGEQTHIIEGYQEARCFCVDARKDFAYCRRCIVNDDYYHLGAISATIHVPLLSRCLSQLGILLLELCFGKFLSEQPCRKEWEAGDTEAERRAFGAELAV
ncbi:hypothetical protein VUR80DRAFT_9565 [Thermomyces stellatus]